MARKDAVETFHTSSNKRRDSTSPRRSCMPHNSTRTQQASMESCDREASATDECPSRATADVTSSSSPPSVVVGMSLNASAKIFESRTVEPTTLEQRTDQDCHAGGRASAETRLPSSASTVYPNSIPGDLYVAPDYTGSPPFAGNWHHHAGDPSRSQVWQEHQNGSTSTSPFGHQLDVIRQYDARANIEALNARAAVAGTHVEIYLSKTFLQKVPSRLLLRFSSVARRMLNSRPRSERQCIVLHAISSELPSMKALLEVVHWMQSTTPHQTNNDLSIFGSAQVETLTMTDLLDMYTAICTFGLEPPSTWQNLWEELTRRIQVRPPLVTALRTFHDCLYNSDSLMRLLLTRAYEGYRTREYTLAQWTAVKAYLFNSDDLPFQTEAVSAFQRARRYHGDRECMECITGGWRNMVRGKGDLEQGGVQCVGGEEGLYCAEHSADGHKLPSVTREKDLGGTMRPSAASLSGEGSVPVGGGRRRCRRAQQRRGKEMEEAAAKTSGQSSSSA